jgi:hypothetical protein
MKTALIGLSCLALLTAPAWAAPLEFTTPEGWKKEKPTNRMRSHQYKVPLADGDTRDAKLIIYYFGKGGGGDLQANIERWKKQVTREEGDPEPKKTEATYGGLKVVLYDVTGTYAPPAFRPGVPKPKPQPGTRIINGVIYTGEGSYYLKFLGPKATIKKQEKAFKAFLASLVASGGAKPADAPSKDEGKKAPTSQPVH